MIQSLTYLCFFVGLIGLNFLFLKDSKKPFHPILWTALTLFILGLAGSFYLSNIHAASILTILISSALGIYISIIRTGLLSTRGIRTGLSLSMIFASLAILDMPTQHLLPQMGNLSFIDKLLFVFLMVSSTTALILNFPNKKIFERDIPFLNLVLYGLLALTISLVLLFFLTESPTALLLVGGATLFSTFFTQHTLLKKHPKQKIQLSQFSFGVQFLWLGLILGYTPLLILAGILCGIALSDSKLPEKLLNKIPINQ